MAGSGGARALLTRLSGFSPVAPARSRCNCLQKESHHGSHIAFPLAATVAPRRLETRAQTVTSHEEKFHGHFSRSQPKSRPESGETNSLGHEPTSPPLPETSSVALDVGGLHCASEKTVVEKALSRRPGVLEVEANPVAHTATVIFNPRVTTPRQRAHKAVKAPAGVLDVAAWSLRHLYITLA